VRATGDSLGSDARSTAASDDEAADPGEWAAAVEAGPVEPKDEQAGDDAGPAGLAACRGLTGSARDAWGASEPCRSTSEASRRLT
jgi:hypothetical protein